MIIKHTIPDRYFKYGTPVLTDYLESDGNGLMYRVSIEEAIEIESNYLVVSLVSAWITGFNSPYTVDQLKLVSVDLDTRTVEIEVIDKAELP